MDPVMGSSYILGLALRQALIISPRRKKNSQMMQKAAERAAEAELKYKKHLQGASDSYTALCTQVEGIVTFLDRTFAEIYEPFKGSDTSLLGNLIGAENVKVLSYVRNVSVQRNFKEFRQLPGYRKQTRAGAMISFLLFGKMGELMQQKAAAESQLSVARLIQTDSDSLCMALDIQKENYSRVQKTLQALNVALLKTSAQVKKAMSSIAWMLDTEGRIPIATTLDVLTRAFTPEQIDQIAINLNIAKCMAAILAEPMFTENAEITKRMQTLLQEGEQALGEIQGIRSRRDSRGKH